MVPFKCDDTVVSPPTYLNIDFFIDLVENATHISNPSIKSIHLTMGSSVGENYCSQIYRTRILYTTDNTVTNENIDPNNCSTLSVILKSIPIVKSNDFLNDMKVFLKEKIFYNNILPLMELLMKDNKCKFGARFYHSLKHPTNTLAFEDLSSSGFKISSRTEGLDEHHVRLTLERLAEFHAISIILKKKVPNLFRLFDTGLLNKDAIEKDSNALTNLLTQAHNALLNLVKKIDGYDKIYRKLENYTANWRSYVLQYSTIKSEDFHVLNHGDLWVNNLLYKYNDEGRPTDVTFIDYQMTFWSSPGIDLNYLFFTSLPLELMQEKYRQQFVQYYHNKLSETLRYHNHPSIPSIDVIRNEVRKYAGYGFFANYAIHPMISMDATLSKDSTLENLSNEEFSKQKLNEVFSSPRLKAMFSYTLKYFDQLKVFD